jgi:Fic family protein
MKIMLKDRLSSRILNIKGNDSASIYSKIAAIDEFKGWFKAGLSLSPQILGRLKRFTLITSTGASTRIEGSKMTDKEVEELLKNIRINRLKDRDSQEVAGYAELMKVIFDDYKNIKFSENQILHLHKILLKYSEKDEMHKGRYKTNSNKVVARDMEGNETEVFNPSEPYITPIEMRDLIEWTRANLEKKLIHPLLTIANFILEFLSIHPFKDGNGRLSRTLTNLLMLQSGYSFVLYASMEKIVEDNKAEYYMALRKSQKDIKSESADVTPWIVFFLETLFKQTELVKKYTEKEASNDMLSENQLNAMRLFDKYEEITNKIMVNELNLGRDTAKQILNRLIKLKLIKRTGRARNIKYFKVTLAE